jgi:hypothetical protein
MRQDPAPPAVALQAFVVDETVYPFQDWLQAFREVEIEIELLLLRMDFEDDREHRRYLDRQSSCRESGRSVSPSEDRVSDTTTRPTILSVDRLIPVVFSRGKDYLSTERHHE